MESGIDEDWQMVDYYPPAPLKQEKSLFRWLMDIGKKVVIGGLVLSSLPFVLPPLLVISSLGLALSLPCAVLLASYVCTQKLMTKLLPSTQLEAGIVGFEDNNEMGYEFDEIGREEGGKGYHDIDMDNNNDVVKNVEEVSGGVDVGEKKPYFNGEDLLVVKNEEKGELKEMENLAQGNNGEVETIITEKDEGDKDEKIITETKSEENLEKEKIMTEQVEKPNRESGKRRKKKKNGGKRREEPENVEADVVVAVEDLEMPVLEEKIEDESGAAAAVEYYKSTTIVVDAAKATEEKDIAPALHSEDQEAFGEEKIWEKIDAIREISGFKAPRRDTYYEELKALYLFTGIEAPSTFSSTPADFAEFYSKLCFLMSVIGVK